VNVLHDYDGDIGLTDAGERGLNLAVTLRIKAF